MKLAIWSPLPPAPSGIADYVAETLPLLSEAHELTLVSESPDRRPEADLDIYHVGNSLAHDYIYRAALERPGVVFLHDWNLHYLLLGMTVERNDAGPYLRDMRRAYRDRGTLVGRQVARALGGTVLPSLFPLNERVLESSLGVVGLSRLVAERVAHALPGRPVLHLPMHFAPPAGPPPTRAEARRRLGLPEDALVVTAPGLATAAKRIAVSLRAVASLAERFPHLHFVVAGGVDPHFPLGDLVAASGLGDRVHVTGRVEMPTFVDHLSAADVILALRFPSFGEMSAMLLRAMGLGQPVLVTAGTPLAEEMPEGTVVPVDPGAHEEGEIRALLARLLGDAGLRERIGGLARAHVASAHTLAATMARLLPFLGEVHARKGALLTEIADQKEPDTLLGHFKDEIRWSARDLGLASVPLALDDLLAPLAKEMR